MTTVALYFTLYTGTTERETEVTVSIIRSGFPRVYYLQGVSFVNASGKPTTVPDPDNRPADLTYFTLRSVVNAADIDNRASDKSLSLDFSLYFPQTLRIIPHPL